MPKRPFITTEKLWLEPKWLNMMMMSSRQEGWGGGGGSPPPNVGANPGPPKARRESMGHSNGVQACPPDATAPGSPFWAAERHGSVPDAQSKPEQGPRVAVGGGGTGGCKSGLVPRPGVPRRQNHQPGPPTPPPATLFHSRRTPQPPRSAPIAWAGTLSPPFPTR